MQRFLRVLLSALEQLGIAAGFEYKSYLTAIWTR